MDLPLILDLSTSHLSFPPRARLIPFRYNYFLSMADSDEEYVGDVTEDEDDLQVSRNDRTRSGKRKQRGGAEWELSRTWETLVEGADGTISSTVEGLLEAGKRKR